MTKNHDPHETVSENGLTLPPPPVSTTTTVAAEAAEPAPEPTETATAFGVELADGAHGATRRAFLIVHEGRNGRVLELDDGDAITFGRSSAATIVIDDPRVSRQHARIYRSGATLVAEDLASRNGTKLNGAALRNARRTVLSGDVVRIGSAEVIVGAAVRPVDDAADGSIGIAAADAKMREVFALAKQLAGADTPVLVQGEPGVGKTVVAHQIHRWSARAGAPNVRAECARLADDDLDAALFGREPHDAADGQRPHVGLLEAAHGGTLLLDGVDALSAIAQKKLLDALEARSIVRTGGTTRLPIDVRVIATTHRDLPAEVAAKRFREDLYYRLSAFTLRVPPLRERHAEIDLFAHLFAREIAARTGRPAPDLDDDAAVQLLRYEWPHNVRELRDAIRVAASASPEGRIALDALPEPIRRAQRPSLRMRVV